MGIFDTAMKMEKAGEKFYRTLADNTDNEELKRLLNLIADEEVRHFKTFEALQISNKDLGAFNTSKKDLGPLNKAVGSISSCLFTGQECEPFTEAQKMEQATIEFYRNKLAEIDDPQGQKILKYIIEEETHHMKTFAQLARQKK